jgi:hypothetical protein
VRVVAERHIEEHEEAVECFLVLAALAGYSERGEDHDDD